MLYEVLTAFLVMATLAALLWHWQTQKPAALYTFLLALNLLDPDAQRLYHLVLLAPALLLVWWLARGRAGVLCSSVR